METILIPTDLSPASFKVLPLAAGLAERINSSLSLIHVMTYSANGTYPLPIDLYKEKAVKAMQDFFMKYDLKGHAHRCYVREGKIGNCISTLTQKQPVSLVIMVNGETAGKLSCNIILNAECPVLVLAEIADTKEIFGITYLLDEKHFEARSIKRVTDFAEKFRLHLTLLSILNGKDQEKQRKELYSALPDLTYLNVSCSFIEAGDIYGGFEKYLKENDHDVIAVDILPSWMHPFSSKKEIVKKLTDHNLPVLLFNRNKLSDKEEKTTERSENTPKGKHSSL